MNMLNSVVVKCCQQEVKNTNKTYAQCQEVLFFIFLEKTNKQNNCTLKTKHSIMKTKHTPKNV